MPPRHALVLAAGLGTRLRPLTDVRAKPAVPLAGEAMVRRIVRQLAGAGVDDVTLNLHHLPHTIAAVLGDGADLGVRCRYSWEQPDILGSAGGPRQALDIIGARTFFIVNGDTLTDADHGALASAHEQSNSLVTLALVLNRAPDVYGGVRLDERGAVTGFVRRGADAVGSFHFIGVQVADRAAFEGVPRGSAAASIGGVYDALLARAPGAVRGQVMDASFWDIGTVADYWRTSMDFRSRFGEPPSNAYIAPSAAVSDSILWDDVVVDEHAFVDRCIVTDGVRVPEGAAYSHSILRRDHDGRVIASPLPMETA